MSKCKIIFSVVTTVLVLVIVLETQDSLACVIITGKAVPGATTSGCGGGGSGGTSPTVSVSITSNPTQLSADTTPTFEFVTYPADYLYVNTYCYFGKGETVPADAVYGACASPRTYSVTSGQDELKYTFSVVAVDWGGSGGTSNQSMPATYTWEVDTKPPPTPTVTAGPSSPENDSTPFFSFTAGTNDNGDTDYFQCSVDDPDFSEADICKTSYVASTLADGSHTFYVRSVDDVGYTSTAAKWEWTQDTKEPFVRFTARPDNVTNDTSPYFEWIGSDSSAIDFICQLDDQVKFNCTNPGAPGEGQYKVDEAQKLVDASHGFSVYAVDAAGNIGLAATDLWTQDTTPPPPPTNLKLSQSTADVNPRTYYLTWESGGGGAIRYGCALSPESAYSTCNSPQKYVTGLRGTYTAKVVAYDAAANESPAASYTWTVGLTP